MFIYLINKRYIYAYCCLVTKSYPTLCHPMDYSLPGFSVHGISQAGILEWVVISFSILTISRASFLLFSS